MCGLIYRKALRLNRVALRTATCGQFINLISNDLSRLDTSLLHIHYLWLGPLEIAIVTYLMYQEVNYFWREREMEIRKNGHLD